MDAIEITDMAGATVEHSMVIVNFVATVKAQLKNSLCHVFSDNVQYKWNIGKENEKTVIPDASINCQIKGRRGSSFINAPQFVMEVVSPSTEKYDRGEKKDLYREQEINEYWIVDWKQKLVEIYILDYNEADQPEYYLFEKITKENKEKLKLVYFPNIKITFDELFEDIE